MPRIKRTLTKSERKMVDDLFKAACKDHNNPTTTANNGANDDSKSKREDSSAADDALSANQPDEKVYANTTEKEDPTSSDEEDELLGQLIYNSSRTAQLRREQQQRQDKSEEEEVPEKKRIRKSFEQRIADLQSYKEKNGHVNVKQREDKSLYEFFRKIRQTHNNPGKTDRALTDDRVASLDALGFDWTAKEQASKKSFEQRMDDLRAFRERHGHVNVKEKEDRSLYAFCKHMRHARNNPGKSDMLINDERIASLDALGFDWTERTREHAGKKSFEQRIEDLRAYKEEHGHVNVKGSEDKSLYGFCSNTRQARKHPERSGMVIINEERIASLDALGFDWCLDSRIKSFEQRTKDL